MRISDTPSGGVARRPVLWMVRALLLACAAQAIAAQNKIPVPVPVPVAVAIANAVADRSRPAADVQLDTERKPAELLAFAGIKPDDRVADLIPGNGYFTRLFQSLVGPRGQVYAVIPASLVDHDIKRLDPIKAILATDNPGNLTLLVEPYAEIDVDVPLDVVWTSLNYHDVYGAVGPFAVASLSGEHAAEDLDKAAFKALKPGGVFIVIDHAAKAGAGASSASTLHRMDVEIVIAQAEAAGFQLSARSDVLANAADSHEASIFSPEIRGHTDKFVLKFIKPPPNPHANRNLP